MLKFATKLSPTEDNFQDAWDAGFRSAEIWLNGDLLKNWKLIAERAEVFPMNYVFHFPNRGPLSSKRLRKAVKLYRRLNCNTFVIHPPMLKEYGKALLEIDPDIRPAVENHRMSLEDFWRWADENTWLTLDVEHLWKYSLEDAPLERLLEVMRDFMAHYGDKLCHSHLPGYEPGAKEHRPSYFSPRMVESVFDLYKDYGFEGLIVSEARPALQTPRDLQADIRLYRNWMEKRSLRDKPPRTRVRLVRDWLERSVGALTRPV